MKIFWLFNHPAPYKVEFFNRLGETNDLTVFYERLSESGRNATFYSHVSKTYHALFAHPLKLGGVNNLSFKPLNHLKEHHQEYDLIVINGWRTFTERLCISYCKKHHIPYVFYINGGIIRKNENNILNVIKTSYIRGANFYMTPDSNSKDYLVYYGAEADKITLFPYGSVSTDEILDKPYDDRAVCKLRSKLNIQGRRVFVSTGFFIERKNFESLIQVWPSMPKDHTLYLIGEGKLKSRYQRLIKKLSLDNVFLLPYMDHDALFRFYRACDAFVFPSKEDIYGHVITEAMSQGLPVYSSRNVNAAKALIKPGINGDFVDFDNHEEVVMRLTGKLTATMKQEAIETAKSYSYESSAEAHDRIFASFLAQNKETQQ